MRSRFCCCPVERGAGWPPPRTVLIQVHLCSSLRPCGVLLSWVICRTPQLYELRAGGAAAEQQCHIFERGGEAATGSLKSKGMGTLEQCFLGDPASSLERPAGRVPPSSHELASSPRLGVALPGAGGLQARPGRTAALLLHRRGRRVGQWH